MIAITRISKRSIWRIVCAVVALGVGVAVQAQEAMRIEALDGGVVDLGAVTKVVGQGQEMAIRAEGSGSRVVLSSAGYLLNQDTGTGASLEALSGGTIELNPDRTLLGKGASLRLGTDGLVSVGTLELAGGASLTGRGTLDGALENSGLVAPGDAVDQIGALLVTGAYLQAATGELQVELRGEVPGAGFDLLEVGGAATLSGILRTGMVDDYLPYAGSRFTFLQAAQRLDEFGDSQGLDVGGGAVFAVAYGVQQVDLLAEGLGFLDSTGPLIDALTFDGETMEEGFVASSAGNLGVSASDPSGLGRLEFFVDGQRIGEDADAQDGLSLPWDIAQVTDGPHDLVAVVYDVYDNPASRQLLVQVDLAPPPAPTIIQPMNGTATSISTIGVTGSVALGAEVTIYRGDWQVAGPIAGSGGVYDVLVPLEEGENPLTAIAVNRGGLSDPSAVHLVTLDSTIPQAPQALTAIGTEQGLIRLAWQSVAGAAGYDLYRSDTPFQAAVEAQKINSDPIGVTGFDDLPGVDGEYFYRVQTANAAGTQSPLSDLVRALSDSTPPSAVEIGYTPLGAHDPADGRFGVGAVLVTLDLSEPLLITPFLSITPSQGTPQSVPLGMLTDTRYQGELQIQGNTPSGTAYAVFSARDRVGNRGTEIDAGGSIEIDTDGPSGMLTVVPGDPVENDSESPTQLQLSLQLDGAPKTGTAPSLSYLLSGPGRGYEPVPLSPVNPQLWEGVITLPADAGAPEPETLAFQYQATDDLDNLSRVLNAPTRQIYQGGLPPLPTPAGLSAKALPAGEVQLEWFEVEDAADYEVYRQAPDETELLPYGRTAGVGSLLDATTMDGEYIYAVASVRVAYTQEALSARSEPVAVIADSVPPEPPLGLTLELVPQGVFANWQSAAGETPERYGLYRSDQNPLIMLDGATLVQDDISATDALDAVPSASESTYVATAFDAAGNQSLPSASAYLNIDLLPVASMLAVREDDQAPTLSWTHTGSNIQGYDLYLGPESDRFKLNVGLLPDTSYIDTGFSGDERLYTIVPVDDNDMAGLGRSLLLPALDAAPVDGSELKRGVMNQLGYLVTNGSGVPVEQIRLEVALDGRAHGSRPFDLAVGESREIDLVVGGYRALPDTADMISTLRVNPNPGEEARILRTQQIPVVDGTLQAQVMTRTMTRGGSGEARFVLENTSELELEIVTARGQGSAPSDEIRFLLSDRDGNVLATAPFAAVLGDSVLTLPDGTTVARISAGGRFESEWVEVAVPAAAPDEAILGLVIDSIHYHLGRDDAVSIDGLTRRTPVALVEAAYGCDLVQVTPEQSFGAEEILIHGQARDKTSGELLGLVPLELVLVNQGFERTIEVTSNANGEFFYNYLPLANASGRYTVSCIHPDLLERPEQGAFVIGQAWLRPTRFELDIPRNYAYRLELGAHVGSGVDLAGLRLAYVAEDQPGGELLPGVSVLPEPPVDGAGGSVVTVAAVLEGDEAAPESGSLVLRLLSDASGDLPLDRVTVEYALSPARPVLLVTPSYIHLGIAHGEQRIQTLSLENVGTLPLEDVSLELVAADGSPAPAWIGLLSPADQEEIPVGDRREVRIAVAPDLQVPEDIYDFVLRIDAANDDPLNLNLFVSVNQSGVGDALFKLSDLYTATLDENGVPIPGLAGATVRLQKQPNYDIERSQITDDQGEAYFTDLPVGEYQFQATAPNHQFARGRLKIEPGATTLEDVFLDYNLVTVEWEVNEITLLDRYELVLRQTFETDVPAPVLVIEPAQVGLPDMAPGDVLYGEIQITNYGLVRADEVRLKTPPADQYFAYEFLADVPDTLEAKQRVTIPYRVTSLRSLNPTADGDAGGGGSGKCPHTGCADVEHSYVCANGKEGKGSSRMCFTSYPPCASSGEGGAVGGLGGLGGGRGSGTGGTWEGLDCDDCEPIPDCAVCKTVDCKKCKPDPRQNGAKCSDKPKEECFVCKNGSCGRSNEDCGASNETQSVKINYVPGLLSSAAGLLESLLNTSPIWSVSFGMEVAGEEKTGEECCKDCEVGAPVKFEDKKVSGEIKLAGSVSSPKFPRSRPVLLGLRATIEWGVGIQGGIEGTGSPDYLWHDAGCDDNKCEQATVSVGGRVYGQGFAVATGTLERMKPNPQCLFTVFDSKNSDCWTGIIGFSLSGNAGIQGTVTGKRVIGKHSCEKEGCSVTAGASLYANAGGAIILPWTTITSTFSTTYKLGALELANCD